MPEFRTCGKCEQYSHSLLRCKKGLVNPPTLKGAISVVKCMGSINDLCDHCKWKQKVKDIQKTGQL